MADAESALRVAVAGANGKTGKVVAQALAEDPALELVGRLVRTGARPAKGEYSDVRHLAKTSPAVLVDFTVFPDSKAIALQAIAAGIRPVIGTSGYQAEDVEELRTACRRANVGGVFAPNFSIGAVLMMQFAQTAARYFESAEIIESHHEAKKDAPSGTASATAQRMASVRPFGRSEGAPQEAAVAARGLDVNGIHIHSVRMPGVIAEQEVRLANESETLVIRHRATSRRAFVDGVLKAVHAAPKLRHLVVGLEQLL
ncbi:MAG: 4-hydroxy-tetrahydrodipicolinate reductase [Candidatus Eremiobacter antarcticus]|nr:4-hydroxy-tetrahydrodipicolinate reductase [Candidatus Eremiobacteraeota bacterium]MBC5809084.1 4-hydroxy-tetrahydrodipicolinate reductase [Candidatus Eremiobacteraeota bacterium]PZR64312.1 MAG: 4-hydroxy-tetrahydrodipicolinate reductase [Candidatus Eremiobacter sp. RRmetagenome_bin22]